MKNKLIKLYRLLATGSAFALFSVGGLMLSIVVFSLQRIIYRDVTTRNKAARTAVHYSFKFFVGYMRLVGILRLDIEQKNELKHAKGKLIIANHPSLIDVVVLISLVRHADCVVKADLWKNPFLKGVVNATGYINNDSDPEFFLKKCQHSFGQGNNLIVFPEGTRSVPGKEWKFKRGVANIALRTQATLLPVYLNVSPVTLTKGQKWYQVTDRRFTFKLRALPGFSIEPYLQHDQITNAVRELTRDLQAYFNKEKLNHE
ncbi:1-acyl-sn-glycerol-3-phosphate acyltransferase [Pseudoalteromonas sp. MMG010]|uniref:lysophospholipid acyltransferase family protein n=1 Tax=Pseudoalteromonas sp. MMG010 TaxID=2822685 RepID=UPI001B39D862|nr:lysophospholipid acyltransferase family protein [Pseudoalteromonas sp. MMG010]MBQ4833483.1 1-acyl-sn-glycerol-3-phosphate acyltransferase [Pseudoalteromonas sp. MMG010]